MKIVAGVDSDRAVEKINSMTPPTSSPRQQGRRRMSKDTGLAAIVFIELHVAAPQQIVRRAFARMLAMIQTGMDIKSVIVFVIKRHVAEKIDLVPGNAFDNQIARGFKV